MDLMVKGKTVLVTGATRGIGEQVARLFGEEGAKVALTYRSGKEDAEKVAADMRSKGAEAMALYYDMGDEQSIRDCVARTEAAFGGIDVLINNAVRYQTFGRHDPMPFETVSDELWKPVLRDTIEGTYLTIQLALPHMREQKWGRIVNTSSMIAIRGNYGRGTYGAAKAAIHGLTMSLARELGPENILVNCVLPGLVPGNRTDMDLPPGILQRPSPSMIQRLLDPIDVARAIVMMGSGANTSMTAQIIGANGGG